MNSNTRNILVLIGIGIVFFIVGNNILLLTNPDEVFYSQTAKEMAQHHTWIVPYLFNQPNFEKPILTYWLLRLGFILFGISNFGARFFPAIFAILGVIGVYIICLYAYKEEKKAFLCAFILASSALYIGLARTVFTDMIFSVFILLSLGSFFIGYVDKRKKGQGIIFFFLFSALAVLTKGPLGILLPSLAVVLFLASRRELNFLFSKYTGWGLLFFSAIAVPWYAFMVNKFGSSFISEFFYNDHIRRILEAEHSSNDIWYFYPLSMIGCMFPWSVYLLGAFWYLARKTFREKSLAIYPFLFFWIAGMFIVFQTAHSKLVSYIFPLFGALAILVGDYIYNAIKRNERLFYISSYLSLVLFSAFPIGLIAAARKYPQYAPAAFLVYSFIALYVLVLIIMLIFLKKKRLLAYIYLCSFIVPLVFSFVLLANKSFDNYVSSRGASRYLLNNYKINGKILSSKFFVRGVRFYTGRDVAVIDINGTGFFSPHPIPYLNSDRKVGNFLQQRSVVYGILKKSAWSDIQRIAPLYGAKAYLLKKIGDEYVIKIAKNNP